MNRAAELRHQAAELRWRARQPVNASMRLELLSLAQAYEDLATEREEFAKAIGAASPDP